MHEAVKRYFHIRFFTQLVIIIFSDDSFHSSGAYGHSGLNDYIHDMFHDYHATNRLSNFGDHSTEVSQVLNTKHGKSKPKSRPTVSYVALIALAIQSSKHKKIRLSDIYNWITLNFPFFKSIRNQSWRNSIRHNLSLNECFIKVDKKYHNVDDSVSKTSPKGHYWTIHPANLEDFSRGDFRRRMARMKAKICHNLPSPYKTDRKEVNQINEKAYSQAKMNLGEYRQALHPPFGNEPKPIATSVSGGHSQSDSMPGYVQPPYRMLPSSSCVSQTGFVPMTTWTAPLDTLVEMFGVEAVTSKEERDDYYKHIK